MKDQRKLRRLLVAGMLLAAMLASATRLAAAGPSTALSSTTQFYVPKPIDGALIHIAKLTAQGHKADANLIKAMIQTPQAVWFNSGTPKAVLQAVSNTVQRAADKGTVPVLVAYNIPFRDCAQYSAGGATRS